MSQPWVVKRKGALSSGAASAYRSAVFLLGVLLAVLVVEWFVAPGQKHFRPTRAVNSISYNIKTLIANGGELLCLYIANTSNKCVKELEPGLARTVKKVRESDLLKAYNEAYDATEPEAPCPANPWPR
jgi:hypothetical protein